MRVLAVAASALVIVGAAFAATINGTQGPDTIYGTGSADTISAGAGDDVVYGQGGNDTIRGNSDGDQLYGGLGDDYLSGGPGADGLYGRAGDDTLVARGPQDPQTQDGLHGGKGDDTFWTYNVQYAPPTGRDDVITCGPGYDVVHADQADEWQGADVGCEVVYVDGVRVQ